MTDEEMSDKYAANAHAMQSGIAALITRDATLANAKHMRVGVNMAMVEIAALVDLLVKKGVFTQHEVGEAILEQQEKEILKYRQEYAARVGVPVDMIKFA